MLEQVGSLILSCGLSSWQQLDLKHRAIADRRRLSPGKDHPVLRKK